MPIFENIQHAIQKARSKLSEHAIAEMLDDDLEPHEILDATRDGEVIEDYPQAYPWPACLLLGHLENDSPVHTVWAYDATTDYAVLVTTYRPDPMRWSSDFRKRVKR